MQSRFRALSFVQGRARVRARACVCVGPGLYESVQQGSLQGFIDAKLGGSVGPPPGAMAAKIVQKLAGALA
jgi:hypothetical protein